MNGAPTKWFGAGLLVGLALAMGSLDTTQSQSFEILSRPHTNSQTAAGASLNPRFSADGRHLLFASWANNLVTNDHLQPYLDLFVHDHEADRTELVSVNLSGRGGGDGDCGFASISSNGTKVVFASAAGDLVPGDTNEGWNIFLRDREQGVTRLISRAGDGQGNARGDAPILGARLFTRPWISADGTRVVFESLATNLVAEPDTNGGSDIFCWNESYQQMVLVSANAAGSAAGNGASYDASMADDAMAMAFVSEATDLALLPELSERTNEILWRDLRSGQSACLSCELEQGTNGWNSFADPVVSPDGSRVAFKAFRQGSQEADGFVHEILSGALTAIPTAGLSPNGDWQFSHDGMYLVFEDEERAYRWNTVSGEDPEPLLMTLVPCEGLPSNPVRTFAPSLSADGNRVAFLARVCDSEIWLVVTNTEDFSLSLLPVGKHEPGPIVMNGDGTVLAFDSLEKTLVADDLNGEADVFWWSVDNETVQVISRPDASRPAGSGIARTQLNPGTVSANGRTVVYTTLDNNVVPQDDNLWRSLVAFDSVRGATVPLDVLNVGEDMIFGVQTNASDLSFQTNAPPLHPSVSADGRFVVLEQHDDPIPSSSELSKIVKRDLNADTVEALRGGFNHLASMVGGDISHDGVFLAFTTRYDGMLYVMASRTNEFLRGHYDVENMITTRLRKDRIKANGPSSNPVLSPDKRWVAFFSQATDLFEGSRAPRQRIYAHDFRTTQFKIISVDENGAELSEDLAAPVFSLDARWVMMEDTHANAIYLHPLYEPGPSQLICRDCAGGAISADARWVAYRSKFATADGVGQVHLLDRRTGQATLVSRRWQDAELGNGKSHSPALSYDGRFVYFLSQAEDLVEEDDNGWTDLFAHDIASGTNRLVTQSHRATGSANGPTIAFTLSADGRTLVVESFASDLAPHDYNLNSDIFRLARSTVDADDDGLEDEWESHYLGGLASDGSGDWDGDGRSDAQEFWAGSDPSDATSLLKFAEIHPSYFAREDGRALLIRTGMYWQSSPGRSYRVEFSQDLENEIWLEFPDTITAGGLKCSIVDLSQEVSYTGYPGIPPTFFRIRLAE